MGLLSNVLGGLAKGASAVGKLAIGALEKELQKSKNARMQSSHMSDAALLNAIKNTRNSIGERSGFLQALKERHKQ